MSDTSAPPTSAVAAVRAVLSGEVEPGVHVQPVVDLQRGTIVAYEALSRFPDVRPDVAFEAAARIGARARLQAITVDRILRLRDGVPPDTHLSVNVDPADLGDPLLLGALLEHAPLTGVVIELTEHSAIDLVRTAELLGDLRSAGARIAADDVGAGYAGMQALLALRPDVVKVDRSLVAEVDTDPVKRELLRMLGDLAGRMDGWLLAEGIETVGELEAVSELGVPLGQGYLFGRPQEPWGQLDDDMEQRIRLARLARTDVSTVAALLEPFRRVRMGDAAPLDGLGVEVDDHDRPLRILVPPGWGDHEARPLVVQVTESVRSLAGRLAMCTGRLPAAVVVTRPNGSVAGIVSPQRVLGALTR